MSKNGVTEEQVNKICRCVHLNAIRRTCLYLFGDPIPHPLIIVKDLKSQHTLLVVILDSLTIIKIKTLKNNHEKKVVILDYISLIMFKRTIWKSRPELILKITSVNIEYKKRKLSKYYESHRKLMKLIYCLQNYNYINK